jgi:drug/metabolite transporter (DMT)-like permease
MVDLVLGILAAVGASTLYSLGIALQALDAREAPQEQTLRLALLWGLVKRVRWASGTLLGILGWPLQVLALLLAPLVVVQPALASGLLVLMLLGERLLNERPGRYEYLAMAAIVLGVIGTAVCAPPIGESHASGHLTLTLVLLGLGLASLLPYALRLLGRSWAELTMLCAGLAFGWGGLATKLAADNLNDRHLLLAGIWGLATGAASILATLSESSALQSRPAIQVAPVVFVTQTIVPVAFAPLLFGEFFSDTPLNGVPLVCSLLVLVVGAAALARSPLLVGLMEGERISDASGSTSRPSEPTQSTIRSSPDTDSAEPSTTSTSPARISR